MLEIFSFFFSVQCGLCLLIPRQNDLIVLIEVCRTSGLRHPAPIRHPLRSPCRLQDRQPFFLFRKPRGGHSQHRHRQPLQHGSAAPCYQHGGRHPEAVGDEKTPGAVQVLAGGGHSERGSVVHVLRAARDPVPAAVAGDLQSLHLGRG